MRQGEFIFRKPLADPTLPGTTSSFLTSTKLGVEPAFLTGWLLTSVVKPAPQCFLFPEK